MDHSNFGFELESSLARLTLKIESFNMLKSNVTHVTSFFVQFAIPITIPYQQSILLVRLAKIRVRKRFRQKSKKQNVKRKKKMIQSSFGIVRMIGAIIL